MTNVIKEIAMFTSLSLERWVRLWAGFLIILGVILTYAVSKYWLLLLLFVGLNLFQSALTGFCPAEYFLRRMGLGTDEHK
jgi:glucan phosphoethanolaminetransferase (alkaline phosphatase superfamily)